MSSWIVVGNRTAEPLVSIPNVFHWMCEVSIRTHSWVYCIEDHDCEGLSRRWVPDPNWGSKVNQTDEMRADNDWKLTMSLSWKSGRIREEAGTELTTPCPWGCSSSQLSIPELLHRDLDGNLVVGLHLESVAAHGMSVGAHYS